MINCKKLFKLQIRPSSLILLITTSQDRWMFPSQSWKVRNSMMMIIIIIIWAKGWVTELPSPTPGAYNANTQPSYVQDRPCRMMNHILQEVALLINRTWRSYRSRPKQCPSPECALPCWRTTCTSVVGGKKPALQLILILYMEIRK